MTKDEQKELLNAAHHLRQAMVHLAQSSLSLTRAAKAGDAGSSAPLFLHSNDLIHSEITVLESKIARVVGPAEKHPGFKCDKADCPVHGKE